MTATATAPQPAMAQVVIGVPEGASGGPALAPTAPLLGFGTIADGTPTPERLTTARGRDNVTLPRPVPDQADDDAATVLADAITLEGDRTLIASGGVVIWYQGNRLVASRLRVDGPSGALTIEGPIHLSRPGQQGSTDDMVLIADAAQLDRTLQDGILRGARLVIARELQLAATEVRRSDGGRYTTMTNVVTSSCQVCASDPTPLWEIRARSITHDADRQELILEHPQLRAFGVPVAAVPFTISAPDPTVERKTGLLRPSLRTTSGLGFGVKIPYFITLGRSADVTLTPYLSASRTRTLEARYRQAFSNGALQLDGAISRDDLEPGTTRGYLFGVAEFDLPRGYRLGLQLQHASDRAYLLDYDVTDADRLWSGITLDRVRRDKLFVARIGSYDSLRDDEEGSYSPAQVADVIWQRRVQPRWLGGEALLGWSAHAHRRPSSADVLGRDMARGSLYADWRRSEIVGNGFVLAALGALDADFYRIAQDSNYDSTKARVTPTGGVELRWPLVGSGAGVTHIVEPVVQLLWSPRHDGEDDIPNEDSRLIEFDEGNLFSMNRFPGSDAREQGLRANLGITWTRIAPEGWSLGVTAGRVLRDRRDDEFGPDSPLSGRRSDWLLAANYDSGTGIAASARGLFDDKGRFSRSELRMGVLRPDMQLSAGYLWINRDRGESRLTDTREAVLNTGWQVAPGWWGSAEARYDFTEDRMQKASLGMQYRNECITLDMGIGRRFTSSDSVRAETDFDLSVRLGGFGQQAAAPGTVARRSCMR
ncbi:MAG: LPS assembly protein LptD [Paracoccus sp. (in: a-proteobacteria)]|uniref:LPS-assembly protein LptD n=1 Tax=Paracoccus sp. TaxID=267 RepID=UPI0026E06723|nr:LPS assembly protein LptD [Paracoccus sp. (in: a-proteobacteria)]MDO5633124.1 LPS assembly protein LptD [Paracoccus sp. (in: a-proteobacteria)]